MGTTRHPTDVPAASAHMVAGARDNGVTFGCACGRVGASVAAAVSSRLLACGAR
jgi:hypothetical protein